MELAGKVALVRFDSTILLNQELDPRSRSVFNALFTIKYLLEFGAKVILASDWSNKINSNVLSAEYVAGINVYEKDVSFESSSLWLLTCC